ncbi:MAG: putative fatty-acid--CoA ligase [Acidimicrobiales bacterium]|nr:putative fatty-acid--CoA ligase [Acidimicrobiales bacterium]
MQTLPLAQTLPQRFLSADRRDGVVTFLDGDDAHPVHWSEIDRDARGMAVGLAARGVSPGDHVALLGPTTRDMVTAIEAVWLAGATVVVLPLPMRMASIEEFVDQTRRRILGADSTLLVIDAELAPFLVPEPGDPAAVGYDELRGEPGAYVPPPADPDALAILQFSSGSTSDPKGVMLPHRTVLANVDAIAEALDLDPDTDVAVSWLPLYHDMGLVGILTSAMVRGIDLVLAGPQTFMASPARWVQWLSTYRGTITAGPNFSWVLAARALGRLDGLDLSPLRVALNGAEPVDPATVAKLVEAGARHGLRAGAVFPAFGMAEVAIAGTFPAPMSGLRTDVVDQRVLETERYAAPADATAGGTKALARLGRPVPGLEIRVVDPETGAVRREREVGELQIRGTSVMTGYYRHPAATAAAFDDGWFRTGDLAYLVDGELVLCGRIKDVIIVAGRNLFPEDVERSVAEIDGVRAGNVIAFGVAGRRREGVVVVAEATATDLGAVRGFVHARVRDVTGLAADDVVLVAPGSLPKTSSGKLQRSLCRDRYLGEALQPV